MSNFLHTAVRLWLLLAMLAPALRAAEVADARKAYLTGNYEKAVKLATEAVKENELDEEWGVLQTRSLLAIGKYPEAAAAVSNALERFRFSIRLRLEARDAYQHVGMTNEASRMLAEINSLGSTRMWAYGDTANLVALGRAALDLGADPKKVLEMFYERSKQKDPTNREPYLALGELALSKHDYDLAAKNFSEALNKFPNDAEVNFGLARAYGPGDRKAMLHSLDAVLEFNPNHTGAMLLLADHLIDAEEFDQAQKKLDAALAVNPWLPEAWAYKAMMREVRTDSSSAEKYRESALKYWPNNPTVDYLIGSKLSLKYRFAEGAAHQRQALRFDPTFAPAKAQLAQDLLRLGQEREGWDLAEKVYDQDNYDVATYNLVTLKEVMDKFVTITNEHFILRMGKKESEIYGTAALKLLESARSNVCAKYSVELARPTVVEIFPEQKDFAVRTFGMPGGAGYLGVCFGDVITANSPASQLAHPSSWEAVLWHEFCHVVTLNLTKNRMPRWLSEGISVYEELQRNPAWGQRMTARYRDMILNGDLARVGDLSSSFLAPKTEEHLMFAYFESTMVVEFLVSKYGVDKLKAILVDLDKGVEINKAIETNTGSMADVEKEFAIFAKDQAKRFGENLAWDKPKSEDWGGGMGEKFNAWRARNSTNYYGLKEEAKRLISEKKFAEAKVPLNVLLKECPGDTAPGNAYAQMARVHRALKETAEERAMLERLAARDGSEALAFERLMEIATDAADWKTVELNARRYLGVNPLLAMPYRNLARANEELARPDEAIGAYRTVIKLDPPNPADAHYRLARLLQQKGDAEAHREVLYSLEEAPRFRDAHELLLKIRASGK